MTSINVTKNDYEIIVATDYYMGIAQANALKSDPNNDSNTMSGMLYHETKNGNIEYDINITGSNPVQITFVFQKVI